MYDMINAGRSKGVFLLQSPAQLKMGQRLRSRTLLDLAYQVALIRPGVGVQGSAVSQFVERYRHGAAWEYDHPLERRALERGYGIIVWQEQVVQLVMDVAGMTAAQADEVRRAFARPGNEHLIALHWRRFLEGAQGNGVSEETARRIFAKVNGHYMFPESHSHAFAVTAYQAAWLKRHHPLEFFTALMNNQPMGFYPLETLKQDARRFGVPFRNPCVNRSQVRCALLRRARCGWAFSSSGTWARRPHVASWRSVRSAAPTPARETWCGGTGLKPQAVLSLVQWPGPSTPSPPTAGRRCGTLASPSAPPGAGNGPSPCRRRTAPRTSPTSRPTSGWWASTGSWASTPAGHLMEFVRPTLTPGVLPTAAVEEADEGEEVLLAGWPVARQHPRGKDGTVFVTIEDETGDVQLILWPQGLRPPPQGAGGPGAPGPRRRLPVGRHHQRHRLPRPAHRRPCPHARRPRLALSGGLRRSVGNRVGLRGSSWSMR